MNLYKKILEHVGHELEAVTYGDPAIDAAIECITCNCVIISEELNSEDET